jgi:hypothetical protein
MFLLAGGLKAWRPSQFAMDILSYEILPYPVCAGMAVYLPWLEILSGLALFIPRFRPGALAIIQSLMGVFVIAMAWAWYWGLDISCGCFGKDDEPANFPLLLIRDSAIFLATIWLSRMEVAARKNPSRPVEETGRLPDSSVSTTLPALEPIPVEDEI